MNFLAHIVLSGDQPKVMVGNFIGDFVKGRNLSDRFEPEVVTGIELHRGIDEFTDDHAVVMESKSRLRAKYRHYAPVIVDVFYDHFLAKEWSFYHKLPLDAFAKQTYDTLYRFKNILPEDVMQMLPYMTHGNWLLNYSKVEGIQRTLTGMSRRTKFDSKMDESVDDLREHYEAFQKEFEQFFPQLQKFSADFLTSRKH